MKIAILTTSSQWFEPYAIELSTVLGNVPVYTDHEKISQNYDVLFILSYHKIIEQDSLSKNKHNLVIHESNLPSGKGWAPLFWQVLEGKNDIVFTLFEAGDDVDNGDIYMQKTLQLSGYELNEDLRKKQAELTIEMCEEFIANYDRYKTPVRQEGQESFYPKRSAKDSRLDINKTIKEQFNLLRTVNNDLYPAFFEVDGVKFILKIERAD